MAGGVGRRHRAVGQSDAVLCSKVSAVFQPRPYFQHGRRIIPRISRAAYLPRERLPEKSRVVLLQHGGRLENYDSLHRLSLPAKRWAQEINPHLAGQAGGESLFESESSPGILGPLRE